MIRLFVTAAIIFLCSTTAFASNPNGLLTLVVGIALLVVATAVLTLILFIRPGRTVKAASIALIVPLLSYSLYVAIDTLTLFGTFGSENSMIGLAMALGHLH